jgi:hypothetical protein
MEVIGHKTYLRRYQSLFERLEIWFICEFWKISLRLDPDSDPRESNQCGSRPTTLPPFVNFLRLILEKPAATTRTITTTTISTTSAALVV